jgi:beta-N-acetylhexosaminidase
MKRAILGIAGPRLLPEERALFLTHRPQGVILFARNIENPLQLAELEADLRDALPAEAVLMVDQEGGRVARLRPPHWPPLGPAGALTTEAEAYAHGAALGAMVRAAGFDVAAAPVLDLRIPGASDVIGDRALSDDPATVARLGLELATGILDAGVTPVMKHIPGHGRALVDSHVALPRVPASDLAADFLPFEHCRELPWAMTAHVVYEQYDPHRPATLSRVIIGRVIRGIIGFKGTLVSDDLAMQALTGAPAERAQAALDAGCDVALYCAGDMPANQAILEALADER